MESAHLYKHFRHQCGDIDYCFTFATFKGCKESTDGRTNGNQITLFGNLLQRGTMTGQELANSSMYHQTTNTIIPAGKGTK